MGIGSELGYLRRQQGISQNTISHKTGLSQQYISRIEKDKPATIETLTKYARILNCDISLYNHGVPIAPEHFRDRYINKKFLELSAHGEVIISHIGAAEALGLFSGFLGNYPVDYYSESEFKVENTVWHQNTHNEIGMCIAGGLRCTDINQTINDLLADSDNIDEGLLLEVLSTYYYRNGKSYERLKIFHENLYMFNQLSNDAIMY